LFAECDPVEEAQVPDLVAVAIAEGSDDVSFFDADSDEFFEVYSDEFFDCENPMSCAGS
jgi:hypothetical protein